ncbi:MAG TPA: hypothetical protein VEQ36_10755 [Thermomicrobiales bacterium]|nr:hypothetical protein [Thermomicrobiales bacterium]
MFSQSHSRGLSGRNPILLIALMLAFAVVSAPLPAGAQDEVTDQSAGNITVDSDGDELSDDKELELGTDPNNYDTDGDGLSDGSEVRADGWGTNPLNSDTDGDGYTDGDEIFVFGTDPKSPAGSPAQQQERSTLRVQVRILPVGYEGNNTPGDSEPLEGITLTVAIPASEWGVSATTDADGFAIFEDLGEGQYMVTLDVPGDAAEFETVFGTEDDFEPRQHDGQNTNQPVVYVGPHEVLNGTFYVIPAESGAEPEPTEEPAQPVPTPKSTMEPVTQFPNTGAGDVNDSDRSEPVLALLSVIALVSTGLIVRGRRVA